jgi:hypothetical protein
VESLRREIEALRSASCQTLGDAGEPSSLEAVKNQQGPVGRGTLSSLGILSGPVTPSGEQAPLRRAVISGWEGPELRSPFGTQQSGGD